MRSLSRVIKAFQYDAILPVFEDDPDDEAVSDFDEDAEEEAAEETPAEEMPAVRDPEEDRRLEEILNQAFEKAKQIVGSAQEYSARILQESTEKINLELAQARKEGYSEGLAAGTQDGKKAGYDAGKRSGYEDGLKEAEMENRKYIEELSAMVKSVEKEKTRILQRFENELYDLGISIARAILKKELETDAGALRSIILNAMDSYRNQAWVRIYVPGQAANMLMKADGGIAEALVGVSDNVKVIAAAGMGEGGCVIEMPDQVIDAGIETQLHKMKNAIETAMAAEQN